MILTPVNSNEDYADDLADDAEITAGTGGAASYSFTGVADGRYMVTLEAKAGSWEEDETKVLSVMHDEESEDEDYTGTDCGRGPVRHRPARRDPWPDRERLEWPSGPDERRVQGRRRGGPLLGEEGRWIRHHQEQLRARRSQADCRTATW